jgi:hypothetical protein
MGTAKNKATPTILNTYVRNFTYLKAKGIHPATNPYRIDFEKVANKAKNIKHTERNKMNLNMRFFVISNCAKIIKAEKDNMAANT